MEELPMDENGGVVGIPAVDPDCKEGDPGCIKGEADNGDDEEEELELKDELLTNMIPDVHFLLHVCRAIYLSQAHAVRTTTG